MIEIVNLKGVDSGGILRLIGQEETDFVIISIPKSTQQFVSESFAIADDYTCAAFAGQLLSNISKSFEYGMVHPTQHESILFNISYSDSRVLAETIFFISCLYDVNELPDADIRDEPLFALAGQFLYEVEKEELVPACPYFIEVVNEFNKAEE